MIYSRKAVQRFTVVMIDLKGLGLNEDEVFYCLEEASKILPKLFTHGNK